jgi:hypothetical protein
MLGYLKRSIRGSDEIASPRSLLVPQLSRGGKVRGRPPQGNATDSAGRATIKLMGFAGDDRRTALARCTTEPHNTKPRQSGKAGDIIAAHP